MGSSDFDVQLLTFLAFMAVFLGFLAIGGFIIERYEKRHNQRETQPQPRARSFGNRR